MRDAHPGSTPAETCRLVAALCFGRRTHEEARALLGIPMPLPRREEVLFEANLSDLRAACGGGLPRIATLQFPFGYDGQIAAIAHALGRTESRPGRDRSGVALVVAAYLDDRPEPRLEECLSIAALPVPRPELLSRFGELSLVFLNECFPCPWIGPGPVRVGLPHAALNPPELSVARFGAGAWFDVLMAARRWEHLDADAFLDLYPREMVEHGSRELAVVPAGSPKFDELALACAAHPVARRKIVYHLSLEKPWVYANLGTILNGLLEHLPDHEIVLRPHPVERGRPEIVQQVQALSNNPRFRLSVATTYVDDYADAQAALAHDAEPVRNFPMASLRPVVQFDPARPGIAPIPLGWNASDLGAVVQIFRELDRAPNQDRERLRLERDRSIPNPGGSVAHVLEHLEDLVERRRVPGWRYHPLFSGGPERSAREQFRRGLERASSLGHPCLALVRRAVERFPEDASFQFQRARWECECAGEGLLNDRWHWTPGLEAAARAWTAASAPDADPELRERIRAWILETGLSHALAWCWNEAISGRAPGPASATLSVLLSADEHGAAPRRWGGGAPAAASDETARNLFHLAAEAFAALGAERLERGRDDLAREALEKAVALRPDHVDALFNLMLLDRMENRHADALARAARLRGLRPEDPGVERHFLELSR